MNTPAVRAVIDVDRAFSTVEEKVRLLITTHPDRIPLYTEGGQWQIGGDTWAPVWTSGFLAGQIWAIADRTQNPWWRERAEHYTRLYEDRKHDTGTHDIGFLFTPAWSRWYRKNPSQELADVIVTAARSLATNFNENGNFLRTWVDPGSSFIDIMMNLDILYHAATICGDHSLADIATKHALTSRRHLVRGDGTVIHEGWFDPESGCFQRGETHQGWRSDSAWVRGQAWAMYGFATCYQHTGDDRFLNTARATSDEYIRQAGQNYVAPNDWDEPNPRYRVEASASSVAAAALLQLGELLGDQGSQYWDYGTKVLATLSSPEYLSCDDPAYEGVIKHATYHTKRGLGVDQSNMWGDYYFVEALERLERNS